MDSRNIPVRFNVETIKDVDSAAGIFGLTRSGLIKLAVALQLRAMNSEAVSVEKVLDRLQRKGRGI